MHLMHHICLMCPAEVFLLGDLVACTFSPQTSHRKSRTWGGLRLLRMDITSILLRR